MALRTLASPYASRAVAVAGPRVVRVPEALSTLLDETFFKTLEESYAQLEKELADAKDRRNKASSARLLCELRRFLLSTEPQFAAEKVTSAPQKKRNKNS